MTFYHVRNAGAAVNGDGVICLSGRSACQRGLHCLWKLTRRELKAVAMKVGAVSGAGAEELDGNRLLVFAKAYVICRAMFAAVFNDTTQYFPQSQRT
jgi:hypothetical protein